MARPTNKTDLLALSKRNFDALTAFIDNLSDERQNREFPNGTMNRNIRDVLAHLHHWHMLMKDWYSVGMKDAKPDIPAKGYTWKTCPELNRKIWEDYRNTDLKTVRKKFNQSHHSIQKIIERHTNEELFEKMKYKWTGTTSLGAYFVSCTSSHYDWALKLIKRAMK